MSREPAPVAVFAYRRPQHLARTLESLAACPEASGTSVTVFADGPRSASDASLVAEVRQVARQATGFAAVRLVERPANLGLARNITSGVTEMLESNDRVIVVEDDLVVSLDFLAFMNAGLQIYADDEQVASIHGYMYPTREALPQSFFLRGADCWGWATWRRGWAVYSADGAGLLEQLERRGLTGAFDLDGAFPYTQMLRDQVQGRNDSWAIRWHAAAFLADRLTLYPGRSLVRNIGLDGSGTHSSDPRGLETGASRIGPLRRVSVVESAQGRRAVARALRRREGSRGLAGRWLHRLASRVRSS